MQNRYYTVYGRMVIFITCLPIWRTTCWYSSLVVVADKQMLLSSPCPGAMIICPSCWRNADAPDPDISEQHQCGDVLSWVGRWPGGKYLGLHMQNRSGNRKGEVIRLPIQLTHIYQVVPPERVRISCLIFMMVASTAQIAAGRRFSEGIGWRPGLPAYNG